MSRERGGSQRFGVLLPVWSLASVLTVVVVLHALQKVATAQEPRGVPVLLLRNCTPREEAEQGDGRPVWVRLKDDGGVFLNQEQVKEDLLVPIASRIFEARQERALYLLGDDSISYDRLVKTAANLQNAVSDLYILLPTSSNMKSGKYPCLTLADARGWAAMDWIRYHIALPLN